MKVVCLINFILFSILSNSYSQKYEFDKFTLDPKIDFLSIGEVHRDTVTFNIEKSIIKSFINQNKDKNLIIFLEYSYSLNYLIDKYIETKDTSYIYNYFKNWNNTRMSNYAYQRYTFLKELIEVIISNNKIQIKCVDSEKYKKNIYETIHYILVDNRINIYDINKLNLIAKSDTNLLINSDRNTINYFRTLDSMLKFNELKLEDKYTIENIRKNIIDKNRVSLRDSLMYFNIKKNILAADLKYIFICGIAHNNKIYDKKLKLPGNYISTLSMLNNDIELKKINISNINIQFKSFRNSTNDKLYKAYFYAGFDKIQFQKLNEIDFKNHKYVFIKTNEYFKKDYKQLDYFILIKEAFNVTN